MSESSAAPAVSAANGQAPKRAVQIAIDGGAGAGKSTVGERLAQRLDYLYVDSGAFYRALTALALARSVAPNDAPALVALAQTAPITIVAPTVDDGRQYTVLAADSDITHALRTVAVEQTVSQVSRHPDVRRTLLAQMRAMADTLDVVMVGRDIGTVVLPDAPLKIYLTASLDARAARRHADLLTAEGADAPSLEAVRADLEARDAKDAAQMRPAEDAHMISNDHRTVDEVVDEIVALLTVADRGLSTPQATNLTPPPPSPAAAPADTAYRAPTFQGRDPREQRVLDGAATPWFIALTRVVATVIFPMIARLHIEGVENVPATGPLMLASNHVAWPDIPMVPFRIKRVTHYMAKIELFQVPILRTIIRLLGAFPIRRGDGDRESLRTAERLLKAGDALIIFPEGHRTGGHLITALPGVALIALRADTPIVPVAISGTEKVFKGWHYGPFAPHVTIRYGKPFRLPQGSGRRSKAELEHGVDEIMRRIAELLPPEYRGVYADAVEHHIAAADTPDATANATPAPADAPV